MPTHILDGASAVRLPRGPLAVSIRTTGSSARIEPRTEVETAVIRPAPHLVVLPRITGPVVLRILPAGDPVFGSGASVALTLGIEGQRGDDPEQVQLPAVDLTGLPHRDLVVVEPRDDGLWVRVTAPVDDETLPGLMGLARAATRRALGVDRVPAQDAVRVVVALDGSASGRLLGASGATAALTEVLVGMSRVLAPDAEPPRVAVMAGDELTWVPTSDVRALVQASADAVAAVPPTIGFRAAHRDLRAAARRDAVVTYVVTDGVPADVGDLEARATVDGEASHLVVLGDLVPESADLLTIPSTYVRTVDGESLGDELSRAPHRLETLVRSLLRGCFVPDSELARRALT